MPFGGAVVMLSPRETETLQHFADGKTYKEVARTMGISHRTVGAFMSKIHEKFDTHTIAHAVATGLRAGIIE